MNKLSIAAIIAGTAAVTGVVVSKILKNKKKEIDTELFEDDYNDCCCDSCTCEEDLDVVIPAEETDDCAESLDDDAEEAKDEADKAEASEDNAEENKD